MRRSTSFISHFALPATFASIVLLACVLLSIAPSRAFAATNYTIDELSTEFTVETDATAHIIERQVITFDGRSRGYIWYLHVPEDGESLRISQIRVAPVDDGGALAGDWTRLQMVDSNPDKQGRNPGDDSDATLRTTKSQPWYSYNIADGMVRSYFPARDGTFMIEADYTISHRVRTYRDVGELYWRYANSSLPVDAHDITLKVALPIPAEALGTGAIVPGQDIVAWGHGPDLGTFEIGEDGSVIYHVDEIASGTYAEAHIIFPSSWLTNVDEHAANVFTSVRREAAISEEATWVDLGMRGATWDNNVRILFLAIAVPILLAGVLAVIRFGRTARARRALIRVSTTFLIVALGEQLFFSEPVTTILLAVIGLAVGLVALWLPMEGQEELDGSNESELPEGLGKPEEAGNPERSEKPGNPERSGEPEEPQEAI